MILIAYGILQYVDFFFKWEHFQNAFLMQRKNAFQISAKWEQKSPPCGVSNNVFAY